MKRNRHLAKLLQSDHATLHEIFVASGAETLDEFKREWGTECRKPFFKLSPWAQRTIADQALVIYEEAPPSLRNRRDPTNAGSVGELAILATEWGLDLGDLQDLVRRWYPERRKALECLNAGSAASRSSRD